MFEIISGVKFATFVYKMTIVNVENLEIFRKIVSKSENL